MSLEKHTQEFLEAVKGSKGDLDAWLECNSETEVREAILSALAAKDAEIAELRKDAERYSKWRKETAKDNGYSEGYIDETLDAAIEREKQ